jgi:hypothetical protein
MGWCEQVPRLDDSIPFAWNRRDHPQWLAMAWVLSGILVGGWMEFVAIYCESKMGRCGADTCGLLSARRSE